MRLRTAVALGALAALCCALPLAAQIVPAAPRKTPTLLVFLTVDQLRADYFEKYESQLTGGLARLHRGGAVFTRAYQDHANTETAPGHASTMSGRHPRSTGIIRNVAGVQDPQAPLVGGGGAGASPFRFRGTVLTDWLRFKDPRTRALSVSRKDRGAILPLGRAKQEAYWYAWDGRFTTSTYYADTLPAWVRRFNERGVPWRMGGQAWTLLLPESAYPEPDSVPAESGGRDFTFPHVLPADSAQAVRSFPEFPWMDRLTLDLALEGLNELQLGKGPQTDVLAVSLSTTDAVGHRYGPDSREIRDQVLRLDRMLGAFLDSLYTVRDSSRVVIALTADHGVTPFPEVAHGRDAAAYHVRLDSVTVPMRRALAARGVGSAAVTVEDGMLMVDRAALAARRVDPDSLARAFTAAARRVPGVLRADRVRDLARGDTVNDVITRRWVNMLPPDTPVEAVVTLRPGHVWGTATYAQHGSPEDVDAHVPVIFYGPGFRPGKYDRFARVVDMAPTLARVLRVTPTELLDGRVLTEALR
ncbi:MAG TPA: alkaline phosphatase family protein [Longimicrobiaceae bacterium]|nr:alkaline phosphatase family protein [Longimicrobiaceae bacterium]